jgi:type I restriction enzyme R subunit
LTRFTDYKDINYRSRSVFSFHQPQTLQKLLAASDTIRNHMKHFPALDTDGFRKCQIAAINKLDGSLAENRPKALVQMATGAGKTFTAITAAYRMLKFGKMNRILFLVDTKSLGEQAEREFMAYIPNDDPRPFSQIYGVRRLKSPYIPNDVQICISTIQRMYSILRGEELDEQLEEEMESSVPCKALGTIGRRCRLHTKPARSGYCESQPDSYRDSLVQGKSVYDIVSATQGSTKNFDFCENGQSCR